MKIYDTKFNYQTMGGEFTTLKQYDYSRNKSGMIKPKRKVDAAKAALGGEAKINPANELTRYHFFEIILRLACLKYGRMERKIGINPPKEMTSNECFHKLM